MVHLSATGKLAEREHRMAKALKSFSTTQIGQIDHESAADNRSTGHADQSKRRFRCSARGDQVVDEQHALIALNGVTVQLQSARAILEPVVMTEILRRQLALFSDRDKA